MNKQQNQIRLIVIAVCLIILGSSGSQILYPLSSLGYGTGYQGAKASYYGIEWGYGAERGKATFLPSTTFHYDADENIHPRAKACNLEGEMTSVFMPESSVPSWVPSEWTDNARTYIKNPVSTYEWEITENNVTKVYAMDEYILRWYFSISAEWDTPAGGTKLTDIEYYDQRYTNTRIWFEFDLTPIWYFEGADVNYFSIAKIRLSDIALGGKLGDGSETTPTPSCSVSPESRSSIISIFYNGFGAESDRAEREPYTFEGKKLNPDLFTDKVYAYFTLSNFGTHYRSEFGGVTKRWWGDVVTVGVDFHVFVVGEWTVTDVQELPEDYGRTSKTGGEFGILDFLGRIVSSPAFQLWSFIGLIALVLLVLAIFAPWVLFALFSVFKRGRKS